MRRNPGMEDFRKGIYRDRDGNEIDLMTYSNLMVDPEYTIIGQEYVGKLFVSTVWLGIPHWNDTYYETMIFPENDNYFNDFMVRYCTYEQAKSGHLFMINLVKKFDEEFDGDEIAIIEALSEIYYP